VDAVEILVVELLAVVDDAELLDFGCLIQKTLALDFDPLGSHAASGAEILY
jgi:hypothetical protein